MSNPEDLEFNPFYQALQTRFQPQYEQAQQNCWLVCIPKASSLGGCTINRQFVDMHLLQPSMLFRDKYTSMVNGQQMKWQVVGNMLEGTASTSGSGSDPEPTLRVAVVAEELAYNRSLQQFKVFITSRPLNPNYKPVTTRSSSQGIHQDALKTRKTFQEHRRFLWSFYNYEEVMRELDQRISTFLRRYLIVEVESLLKDTALKLEGMAKQASISFFEANRRDARLLDRRVQEAVWMSMEAYLMCGVHSKVFSAVCRVHAKEDRRFADRCRRLRGHLTPSTVGVHSDYQCPYRHTLSHLNRLEELPAPLEQLYCLQDAVESIITDAKEHFTNTLRHGEPQLLASDDLIALLATIIVQADCPLMISSLYYMENFHWSLSDSDKLCYVLVTFRAAVEYIRGPEVEKLLPKEYMYKPPMPKLESRGSPPSHSSSQNSSPISHALSESLASMEQETVNQHRPNPTNKQPQNPKKSELGPFLSMLVDEDTVTSSYYYGECGD